MLSSEQVALIILAANPLANARPMLLFRTALWTAGLVGLAVHIACAFHFLHDWSHSAALKHTAERTFAVTGWHWPGGLYINYAFLGFWLLDAVRVWREALGRTPIASLRWRIFVHSVFLFMMFNATVVFGPWHWAIASVVFALAWWRLRPYEKPIDTRPAVLEP